MDWWLETIRVFGTPLAALIGVFLARRIEIAKLDTRLEKLDHIEIEVQRVTRAQEEIRHEITSREWKRSWKREAYVGFLSTAQKYALHITTVRREIEAARAKPDVAALSEIEKKIDEFTSFPKEFIDSYTLCTLVAPEKVAIAAAQLSKVTRQHWAAENWSEDFKTALTLFTKEIREDLGFER